ncbi:MAG: BTAD domain-containing putative transcriptional regulator, partial [Oscillospiraceae bacterium]
LKNLRNTLYTLKRVLGGELLLSPQKALVTVNPQWSLDCDYDRFTREGDFSAYRGPFLQGFAVKQAFSYDEWVSRTREKLHEQYLRRLEEKARAALEAGEQEQAADWASEYLREDPFDEPMSAFLMERWRETKKYAKAAQVYQRLKSCLSEDLGVDPQESTTMLYYEIMN